MKLHANAALSWSGRRRLCLLVVDDGWTVVAAAAAMGVSVRYARKWIGRYRLEGERGLLDRSSAPRGSRIGPLPIASRPFCSCEQQR
jgi:transposase